MLFYILESDNSYIALSEMKTKEEYSRRSFKKKYNFKPSKEDKDIGTITDPKTGKEYKIDMRKDKYERNKFNLDYYKAKKHNKQINHNFNKYDFKEDYPGSSTGTIIKNGKEIKVDKKEYYINPNNYKFIRSTTAKIPSSDSEIELDRNFFKKKGSNHNERRDSSLQHEIGHHKTLNFMSSSYDNNAYDNMHDKMSKYELKNNEHAKAEEFMADKIAVDNTSKSALKKSIRESMKNEKKLVKKEIGLSSKDLNNKKAKSDKKGLYKKFIKDSDEDIKQRGKVLNKA